jgi:Flp pilus assembly protein TadG
MPNAKFNLFTKDTQRGQAIILLTTSMLVLCGMLGLVVDFGWAYFVTKAARAAADAAALATVQQALDSVGQSNTFECGTALRCQAATTCPPSIVSPGTNVETGCVYAQRNGFTQGGQNGRQSVVIAAGTSSPPPTAPGLGALYWATVTVSQRSPQLFSSLMGNKSGTISVRSTAALVDSGVRASLVLTNHENDCIPMENPSHDTCGVNLLLSANDNQGQPAIRADGGIMMASQLNGTSATVRYAGENTGGGSVRAPATFIRGNGGYSVSNNGSWTATPQNLADENAFRDPMRGKGQPAPPTGLIDVPITGGQITGSADPQSPLILTPGNYFAVSLNNKGVPSATGDPIQITGYVQFSAGATGFGRYVVFGGFTNQSAAYLKFEPGMYVLAGVKSQNQNPSPLLAANSNMSFSDMTTSTGQNSDAGELFIFTDTNYIGQGRRLEIPSLVQPVASNLRMGTAGFQSGNNSSLEINLHGLNRNATSLPADLKDFSWCLFWQDQANSVVKYTADGEIDTSCGNADGCPNTALWNHKAPELFLQGSPNAHFYGTVYQPRGAWTSIIGGGNYEVPAQVIAGAVRIQGNASFSMVRVPSPVLTRMVALVE